MIDLLSQHLCPHVPDFLNRLPIVMQHLQLPIPRILSVDFSVGIDYLDKIYATHEEATEAWMFFQKFGQDTFNLMTFIADCMVHEGIAENLQSATMIDGSGRGLYLEYYPSITWRDWDETGNPCRTLITTNNSRAIVPYIPTLNGILGLYHEEAITITPTPVNSPANSFSILEKFPGPGMDIDRSNDQMMETEY